VVAVVSALGDVTDLLLEAANDAREWSEKEILEAIDELRKIHRSAVEQSSLSNDGRAEVLQGV